MNQQGIFQTFGHITVLFSTLDFIITRFMIELVSKDYKASTQPLKDTTTLGVKLKRIEELRRQDVISEDVLQQIKHCLPEAIEVSNMRNRFMHDQWIFNPETLEKGVINRIEFTDLKNWNTDPKPLIPYNVKDLEDLLSRIGDLQCTFATALDNLQLLSVKA